MQRLLLANAAKTGLTQNLSSTCLITRHLSSALQMGPISKYYSTPSTTYSTPRHSDPVIKPPQVTLSPWPQNSSNKLYLSTAQETRPVNKPVFLPIATYSTLRHSDRVITPPQVSLSPWQQNAIKILLQEQKSCPETPIYLLGTIDGVAIYAKDESQQPTGSHKHRLARSLLLHALRQGFIDADTHLVEASSGGTACSEAYFAKLLGLPYTAVVPKGTPQHKLDAIKEKGGKVEACEPGQDKVVAKQLEQQPGWYFIDQFANAGAATDNEKNIASELVAQFQRNNTPMPRYVVTGAGTGGTSATLGGYFQQHGFDHTEVIVGDPENSAFHPGFTTGDMTVTTGISSRIGGIGRPRVEPAFDPKKVAEVMPVPDAASIAACHFLQHVFGLYPGGSTGTNFFACLELIERMRQRGEKGSILIFIFDRGELYENTYYNAAWLKKQDINIQPYLQRMLDLYSNYSDNKAILKDPGLPNTLSPRRFRPCPTHKPTLFSGTVAEDKKRLSSNELSVIPVQAGIHR